MLFIWESVLTLFAEVSVGFGCSAFLVSLEYDFVLGIGSVFMLDLNSVLAGNVGTTLSSIS